MDSPTPASDESPLTGLADAAVARARSWIEADHERQADPGSARLAALLKDPAGLDFTLGFVDRVSRPEDLRVAARNLERLSRSVPRFLPPHLRAAVRTGGALAPLLPWPIIPLSRRALRVMVGHLIIDAGESRLTPALARLRERGARLNLNLLGEAVLGEGEATRRLDAIHRLIQREDVDHVSVKLSSVASQLSPWAFEETAARLVRRLSPLYETAAAGEVPTFINLDMEEYRDLGLTIAVFTRMLEQPSLRHLEAGIVLQAYLPDSVRALRELTTWARRRREGGGAGIKVRIVKGANLPMERVDAITHGWPLATWGSKLETDTNYKRLLDWALSPENASVVRVGVAGHNLFDLAFALELARRRGVQNRVEFEMLLGMAVDQAEAVRRDVGAVRLYTPLVHPEEFDAAIGYLVRRLEESASPDNFMSALFDLTDPSAFAREESRFRDSLTALDRRVPEPHRTEAGNRASASARSGPFANVPDTDPAIPANRAWARQILARSSSSDIGRATEAAARVDRVAALEKRIAGAARAGLGWGRTIATDRAALLHRAGEMLERNRSRLIEVMVADTAKVIGEADIEVSEAVDYAHFYAERCLELEQVQGARFIPSQVTLVTPPWNFPVAIPAGSVLAALAAGSAVILKPAPQARRVGAVLAEAFWQAGFSREVLTFVDVKENTLGRKLVAHPSVDRLVLTGSFETARLFRSWRPDLPLLAETSGKNAIVVTPSADIDLAVADIVKSAFGHAGQKCSAASLVILVGTMARSDRFRRQLVDAVSTLRVGPADDPATQVGPIIEPASGKLLTALTTLDPGERWIVEPGRLDAEGRLWSPGVREGVRPGSAFHMTEYFGPVLGVMTAASLDEAIRLQNGPDYGLTAGLHSLDADEVAHWIDRVEAGNLYVNRAITGAVVRRQPFGGWKRSSVGVGAKTGGPNYLFGLGSWEPIESEPRPDLHLTGIAPPIARLITAAQPGLDFPGFDRVRTAAVSDASAWREEFGVARDASGLGVERNVLRYRPVPVTIRLSAGQPMGHLVRLLCAAALADAPVWVSSAVPLPASLVSLLPESELRVRGIEVEPDARFVARMASTGRQTGRIRLIGGDAAELAERLGGDPDIAIHAGPVTTAGRVELLTFLREQSVSITAHRFGNPDRAMLALEL